MRRIAIAGWCIMLAGTVLWLYGYFATGSPPFIDWAKYTPWWIADFLPNIQSEIGMALVYGSMVLIYWPGGADTPDTRPR
jgi:hypothetical protein